MPTSVRTFPSAIFGLAASIPSAFGLGCIGVSTTIISNVHSWSQLSCGRSWRRLRKSLASTNIIESAFSVAEHLCRRVKRWRQGDHRERWAGSALLLAESKFRRLKGYREISKLGSALADHGIKKGLAVKAKPA